MNTPAAIHPGGLARLWVLTDRHRCRAAGRSLAATVAEAVRGGARAVLLRDKDLPRAERAALAEACAAQLHAVGGHLIVASDTALARAVGAAGVHLAAGDPDHRGLEPGDADHGGLWVGRSCHDAHEIAAARREGADWVTVSPVRTTDSKPGYGPALGIEGLAALVGASGPVPVLALGGLGRGDPAECLAAGAHGVAVMGTVMGAADPAAVVADLVAEVAEAAGATTPTGWTGSTTGRERA